MGQAGTNTVGTLGLSVRCRTILTMYPLTGTDAQTERPYTGLLVLSFDNKGLRLEVDSLQ